MDTSSSRPLRRLKSSPAKMRGGTKSSTVTSLPRIGTRQAKPRKPARYYYVLVPGNNSGLVRQALRRRAWWSKAQNDGEDPTAEPTRFNLRWRSITGRIPYESLNTDRRFKQVVNHIPKHNCLVTKSGLCTHMQALYAARGVCPWTVLPRTFLVQPDGTGLPELREYLDQQEQQCTWILKPSDASRGVGISVLPSAHEVLEKLQRKPREWVVQQYITDPMLLNGRKFDLRLFVLVDAKHRAWVYHHAYARTAVAAYSSDIPKSKQRMKLSHLTNTAVQSKAGQGFGAREEGNQLTLEDLERALGEQGVCIDLDGRLWPKLCEVVAASVEAVAGTLNSTGVEHCFELYGYDFMLDQSQNTWLLEVNSNPCLEVFNTTVGHHLDRMVDDIFKLQIDPLFPAPSGTTGAQGGGHRFHQVYDPRWEGGREQPPRPALDSTEEEQLLSRDVPLHRSSEPVSATSTNASSWQGKGKTAKRNQPRTLSGLRRIAQPKPTRA
eukprot:TRINITY_DN6045_c0_g1_i1.p1 TRINITY_DN6045_c0_g1~~TRINITY_DN6045_c0_g1_i1.p1  ORF type:complete len:494 (+),score=72.04 TRINITY_DN6045_c0_g1_i1:140-1621(+)